MNSSTENKKEKNSFAINVKQTFRVVKYFIGAAQKEKPMYFVVNVVSYILGIFGAFFNIVAPKYLIDMFVGKAPVKDIALLAGIIVVTNTLLSFIRNFIAQNMEKYSDFFDRYFTMCLSRKSMRMDFEYTEDPKMLDELYMADSNVSQAGGVMALTDTFMSIVSSSVVLVGVTAIIVTSAPILAPVILITTIISFFMNKKMNQIIISYVPKATALGRHGEYFFGEMSDFRYGKDVRLYGMDKLISEKTEENIQEVKRLQIQQAKDLHLLRQLDGVIGAIVSAVITFYIGFLAIKKMITIGDLSMLSSSASQFGGSVDSIVGAVQDIALKSELMIKYVDFMENYETHADGGKSVEPAKDYVIEFKNVSFKYPRAEEYVLKNINITIHGGEHLAIVGLNGAGKTTFIKLLCRLYKPTEGEILLNGVNINEYDFDEYAHLFSPVFQDFSIFAFTVKENIALSDTANADYGKLWALCGSCGLTNKVKGLPQGLDTLVFKEFDETGFEPSGGEQQKIAIARALYKDAPIVVLDEPTAALDPVSEYEIYTHFNTLTKGKSAIYISHRLATCRFCDRIAVFHEGEIIQVGNHEQLMDQGGLYGEMFMAQMQYYMNQGRVSGAGRPVFAGRM